MSVTQVEVRDVTESNLNDIPETCRLCVYWSLPEEFERTKEERSKHGAELEARKRQWITQTREESGDCGKILYHNKSPVGYAEYGPASRFPQINAYDSQPIGEIDDGVVFLSCLFIAEESLRGKGLGERLLENVIADLRKWRFKALETYARRGSANNPSGPAEFYLKRGFHIKDETDPEFPILRLDL